MQVGKASLRFEHPAFVASWASVAGKKEGQGPLADEIDVGRGRVDVWNGKLA